MKIRLTHKQVMLALRGASEFQNNPSEMCLTYSHFNCLERGFPLLTQTGAKLFSLGGGWWNLIGYGYTVRTSLHKHKTLCIDVRDTLRTLGFAA